MQRILHFVDGQSVTLNSSRYGNIHNPATGEKIAEVLFASEADVGQVVKSSLAAFSQWRNTPVSRRVQVLFKYKQLLEQHMDELAALVTREHGKTLEDARGSIRRGIDAVDFACGAPAMLKGDYSENVGTGVDSYAIRQPIGVCVGITPFNFPSMIANWMFPIAIASGNTFILKPSEKDPSCGLRMVQLLHEAGLPKGVINVVHGDKEAVLALLKHPGVQAVSFVGSTPVAEFVQREAIAHGKRVQAFGGAKNHMVVMPDADIGYTADNIIGAAYGSCGQRCMAISVVVAVGDATADQLISAMQPKIAELKIGPGDMANIDIGPLVSQEQLDKVKGYIDIGLKEGAKLVLDGRGFQVPGHERGFFIGPCLFDGVKPNMRIYQEEIFGPVLCIIRAKNFDEAIELVNQHPFGNGTAIFTNQGNFAREYAERVQVGLVGINVPIPVPVAYHSFGGWKRSIFADMHMHGEEGFRFYTKMKNITTRFPKTTTSQMEFAIPTMK